MVDQQEQSFFRILRAVGDIESVWALFHTAIVDVAVVGCGRKIAGVNRGGNSCTHWWTPGVRGGHYHVTPIALQLFLESRISPLWFLVF